MCYGKLKNANVTGIERVYSREWSDAGAESLEYCDAMTVDFISPTSIYKGKNLLTRPSFSEFIDSLFGRISAILDNYGSSEFVLPYKLFTDKPYVTANYDLKTIRFQTSSQPTDGVVGSIHFLGDITRYLPYIDLGSQVNIGKKTTRGCGQYIFRV